MNEIITAEAIGKKARALKHCNKLLSKINKEGSAKIVLNCTGVEFVVHKGDAIHLKIQTTRAQLTEDINSYDIVRKANTTGQINECLLIPSPIV